MSYALLSWSSYQLWKVQCRLNLPLLSLFQRGQQQALDQAWDLHSVQLVGFRPALCIVVTTHKRPDACAELLRNLHAELPPHLEHAAHVIVLDDTSDADYAPVRKLGKTLYGERFIYTRSRHWLGKQGYWLTYQAAFELLQQLRPACTLFIQDDLSLAPGFFVRAFELWGALQDKRKAVLSLVSFRDDEKTGRWVSYARRELLSGKLRRTQWFDLPAYLVDNRFFEALRYRVYPPDPLRFSRQVLSSGVGEQFTRRLWRRGNIYQVAETLVFHGAHESVMNVNTREDRPFDNRVDLPLTARMARAK